MANTRNYLDASGLQSLWAKVKGQDSSLFSKLVGASADASAANTIYGAKKYAADVTDAALVAAQSHTDAEIGKLDASVKSADATATAGEVTPASTVAAVKNVEVVEENGKITGVNVEGVLADAAGAAAAVLGSDGDASTAMTVYGVKAYAAGLVADAVSASGDSLIDASASENHVSIAAQQALVDAVANANSALQSVSASGSDYIDALFSAKDANAQALSIELTIQRVADASSTAKGLAESSDVKAYVEGKIADLGTPLEFIGAFTTKPTEGHGGRALKAGDVYINPTNHKEYIYSEGAWVEFGDEGSYALKTTKIVADSSFLSVAGTGQLEQDVRVDLGSDAKENIAKGLEAHGWGDHALAGYAKNASLLDVSKRLNALEESLVPISQQQIDEICV